MASDTKLTVAMTYEKWARLLRHLDAPVTGGEGQMLGHEVRKQILAQLGGEA